MKPSRKFHEHTSERWFVGWRRLCGGFVLSFGFLALPSPLHAETGFRVSTDFTLDVRFNPSLSQSSGESRSFNLDTRNPGLAGSGASTNFTLDTRGATVPSVTLAGRVTDENSNPLAGATVQALQSSVLRAQITTGGDGHYQLPSLASGTYELRAAKADYLTGVRYGINLSLGNTVFQDFALTNKPPAPVVETVDRPEESSNLPNIPGPQLKVFVNGAFVVGGPFDPAKPTVILTHGWNSDPDVWAKGMATNMIAGGANANILAWDWWQEAKTGLNLPRAHSATPREGTKLGQTLATTFTPAYNQGVHFIGHSLGALVNATAADYLHTNGHSWTHTHMTLLDDAEAANRVSSGDYVSPIPRQRAWVDNYVSIFGLYHSEAVNVLLVKSPYYGDSSNPKALGESVHRYACLWYSYTAATPSQSLLGNQYSFEQLGSGAQFPSPNPYPLGAIFSQDILSSQELVLNRLLTVEDLRAAASVWAVGLVVFGLESSVNFANGVVQKVGVVAVDVAESFIPQTPLGTPVFTGTAGSTPAYYTDNEIVETPVWSFQVNLQTTPPTFFGPQSIRPLGNGPQPQDGGETTNETPRVWIPVAVPTNAALFCFDFSFNGDPGDDMLSASIGQTNVFALEAKYMPTNMLLNSGPIDVSAWAGQTVEFFFGVLGGTSTNADVTLSGMRFYQVEAPALSAELLGNELLVSWPATISDYVLESTPVLADLNQWSTVTNVPASVGLRNVVTNSLSSEAKFYRLKK